MANRGIKYVKQEQPSFIRKFQEKAGMKPEATIADKYQTISEDCVDEEKEDEKPVVVVLKEGDLTAEEAESQGNDEEHNGKIVFKKPTKRSKESALGGTTKKLKSESGNVRKEKTKSKVDKKQKQKSLLSFDEDDDA
ncbi:uncharacterized protein KIAA1143 homolog [Styela clava]|uniref:uncharacterized protein KIAA1143 homolog n=1 Tax=Styela clava TaxID=7725 RepID=UPI00193A0B25|nr:uncharacterized protein KIAA1143 homolog [Styela clava]